MCSTFFRFRDENFISISYLVLVECNLKEQLILFIIKNGLDYTLKHKILANNRVYSKIKELPRVYNGLGISVLSTPKGVLSDGQAREMNVGGEVLFNVY